MLKSLNEFFINSMIKRKFGIFRIVEVFLMLIAFWWSIVLFMPSSTFSLSLSYRPLLEISSSEETWAVYFMILGVLHLLGLKTENKKTILLGLMLSTMTWLFIGAMIFIGSPVSTGTGTYLLIGFLSASTYFYKGIEK